MKNIFIVLTLLFSLHLIPSAENISSLNDKSYIDQKPISEVFVTLVYEIELTQNRSQTRLPQFLSLAIHDFSPKLRPSTLIFKQKTPYRNYPPHTCELYTSSGPSPPSFV